VLIARDLEQKLQTSLDVEEVLALYLAGVCEGAGVSERERCMIL
jgi:hypothetical protein